VDTKSSRFSRPTVVDAPQGVMMPNKLSMVDTKSSRFSRPTVVDAPQETFRRASEPNKRKDNAHIELIDWKSPLKNYLEETDEERYLEQKMVMIAEKVELTSSEESQLEHKIIRTASPQKEMKPIDSQENPQIQFVAKCSDDEDEAFRLQIKLSSVPSKNQESLRYSETKPEEV